MVQAESGTVLVIGIGDVFDEARQNFLRQFKRLFGPQRSASAYSPKPLARSKKLSNRPNADVGDYCKPLQRRRR